MDLSTALAQANQLASGASPCIDLAQHISEQFGEEAEEGCMPFVSCAHMRLRARLLLLSGLLEREGGFAPAGALVAQTRLLRRLLGILGEAPSAFELLLPRNRRVASRLQPFEPGLSQA